MPNSAVETGHTIRWFQTTTEELARFVKRDVARWQADVIHKRRQPSEALPTAEEVERRDLATLLHKVRTFWVDGALKNSVAPARRVELHKTMMVHTVDDPLAAALELPDGCFRHSPLLFHPYLLLTKALTPNFGNGGSCQRENRL